MQYEEYFYNCSKEYIGSVDPNLYNQVMTTIKGLPKRNMQAEINQDLFWALVNDGWSYDTTPNGLSEVPPPELNLARLSKKELSRRNNREFCSTSSTLGARWHSDFARQYQSGLVQIEVQFGTVEAMFKDFCGFRIAYYERRLSLGIEIVMYDPKTYFSHRKSSVTGMAYFDAARKTLPAIGLNCPIWLLGIKS